MVALWKALNKYTQHKARLITLRNTYLEYDTDVFDPALNRVDELVDWADFFILGEILDPRMHTEPILNAIKPDNCIVRAGGTNARAYPLLYMTGHYKDIMKTGAYHDHTIASRVFPMAHTVNMAHFEEWPEKKAEDAPIKIIFTGSKRKQRDEHSGEFKKAWESLYKKHGERLQFTVVQGTAWKRTLAVKSECHICFDQLQNGAYANSAIEGMWYKMPTFCYISNWCRTIHPDVPAVNVKTAGEIVQHIDRYIADPDEMHAVGEAGRAYVKRMHSAENAIKRWEALISYVTEEYRKS